MTDLDPAQLRRLAGEMTATTSEVVESFGRAVRGLLGHRADMSAHLDRTLTLDPNNAMGHLLRGFALCFLGRRDLQVEARRHLAAAGAAMSERGAVDRERALSGALGAWLGGDASNAAARLASWLKECPSDVLAFRLDHSIRFQIGDSSGMREAAERAAERTPFDHPGYGYVFGCLAFAREETGAFAAAERAGRAAVDRNAEDVWAIHAVAHVLLATDRITEGVDWLSGHDAATKDLGNFAGHIAWHQALFLLDLGQWDRVVDLYDRRIAIYPPRDYRDVSNATSLLIRLENAGVDVGARWGALAEVARGRRGDHGLAFADIHYALALLGDGELELARGFLASMEDASAGRDDEQAAVIREVGLPIAREMVETMAGGSADLNRHVAMHRQRLTRIGGSWAQRAIFDWVADRSFRPANAEFEYGAA